MSKQKLKQSTLARLQNVMKDADGHRETVMIIYVNHITKRYQNGVIGNPDVLHTVWAYMIDQYEKDIADQPTKMAIATLFAALALYYEPDELAKKMADIRAAIKEIKDRDKN